MSLYFSYLSSKHCGHNFRNWIDHRNIFPNILFKKYIKSRSLCKERRPYKGIIFYSKPIQHFKRKIETDGPTNHDPKVMSWCRRSEKLWWIKIIFMEKPLIENEIRWSLRIYLELYHIVCVSKIMSKTRNISFKKILSFCFYFGVLLVKR